MERMRKVFIGEVKEVNDEERTLTALISTGAVDRDGESLSPDGATLTNYKKNPVVMWAHNYREPPIGKNLWVKKTDDGILAKTQFAKTAFADEIFGLYKGDFLRAWSVGFIPDQEAIEENPEGDGKKKPRRTYNKWELLEYSAVPIPANPEALTQAVEQGLVKTKTLIEDLGITITDSNDQDMEGKKVIPFKETPKAPEDAPWDAGKEVREAEVSDLKIMCTWFDSENPDIKGSYKLPHHKARGHAVVWRGVAAAMGALLGARGGVALPAGDRKGVYRHLSRHYDQFEKTPPEFREYSEEELKELFNSGWKDYSAMALERANRVISEAEGKVGAVLNRKNKQNLKNAQALIQGVLDSAETQEEIGSDSEKMIIIKEEKREENKEPSLHVEGTEIAGEKLQEIVKATVAGAIRKLKGKVN